MAEVLPEIDTSRRHPARIYHYMLGGRTTLVKWFR
jgi:hypothetical protein